MTLVSLLWATSIPRGHSRTIRSYAAVARSEPVVNDDAARAALDAGARQVETVDARRAAGGHEQAIAGSILVRSIGASAEPDDRFPLPVRDARDRRRPKACSAAPLSSAGHRDRLGIGPRGDDRMADHYYDSEDLRRFSEIGKNSPDLAAKFFEWYGAVFADGALSAREKAVIALAVAHAVQCPYCIDAYSRGALEKGADLDQMTEAVHVAAAIRGGAALVHGVQMRGHAAKVAM
jgi:alkylhydroperoxidase/carboxymuconolactone decarboxylase family protein